MVGALLFHHVRMHVCDQEIHSAIVVEVEKLQAHASPGRLGKIVLCFFDKLFAAQVLEIVSRTLHVQEVHARPTITFQIGEACVATPAARIESHICGDILELIVAQIFVENRVLEAFGMEVAGKRVLQADVSSFWSFFVAGINADIADEQIDQTIVIVVKEESPGGMSNQIKASFMRNVLEMAMAIVLEENITFVHGGYEEILMPGVVDIAERGGNADAVLQAHAGLLRNVLKFSIAQISPEFVAAELIYEVDVVLAITIHIRYGNARAVVVVDRHILARGIRDRAMTKGDSTLLQLISKMKLMKNLELIHGLELRLLAGCKCGEPNVISWKRNLGRGWLLRSKRGAQGTAD